MEKVMSALPKPIYTLEEYLELEQSTDEIRYEFFDGEVWAMAGASDEHDRIQGNIFFALRSKFRGRKCRAFLADMRVKVPAFAPYRYPDLSALCGEEKFEFIGKQQMLLNPNLIVEILSPSTEAFDRGSKFTYYKSIESFNEYLLVSTNRSNVAQFIKQADGSWRHYEFNDLDKTVKIESLDCEIEMREIYEDVAFPPDSRPPIFGIDIIN
jgi:Uma2 family endonuclease